MSTQTEWWAVLQKSERGSTGGVPDGPHLTHRHGTHRENRNGNFLGTFPQANDIQQDPLPNPSPQIVVSTKDNQFNSVRL